MNEIANQIAETQELTPYIGFIVYFMAGLLSLASVVIWYNIRAFVISVRDGFASIDEKMDDLIKEISKLDTDSKIQNERISSMTKRYDSISKRVSKLEDNQLSCKNYNPRG